MSEQTNVYPITRRQQFIKSVSKLVQAERKNDPLFKSNGHVNRILIIQYQEQTGQSDFRTYKNWQSAGFQVRNGEKGFPIFSRPLGIIKGEQGKIVSKEDFLFFGTCYLFHPLQVQPRLSN